MAIDSKRIAKNTLFLYARLLLVMGVTLYTSRVVLDKLGIDDFGLYNVIFSIIGLLSFLNGTLSFGTSRFITFELGKNDKDNLKLTFSTALGTHIFLSVIILLLGETLGLWYVNNIMECPPERFNAAFIVYQISILQTIISILQVPFTSDIIAHERMDYYAYIGIYGALAKLFVVFLLIFSPFDRLVYYAVLMTVVSASVLIANGLFCKRHFFEVELRVRFDKKIFRSLLNFSGWNLVANLSNTMMSQGVVLLLNLFFLPFVVTARAISNQISTALMQFVDNVRNAVNPQVIKLYAECDYSESKQLTLVSAEYVFYLLLLLGIPAIMTMPQILNIWLVEVPGYAVEFARLIIIQDILGNFSAAFYTPMVAANKIKKNTVAAVILCIVQFSLLYLLFKIGLSPLWASYLGIISCIIWSFIIKPYILWKDINYSIEELSHCIFKSIRTLIPIIIVCIAIFKFIPQNTLWKSILVAILSVLTVLIFVLLMMEKKDRSRILCYIKRKLR